MTAAEGPETPAHHREETGSTNIDARNAFAAGTRSAHWYTATRQTAGVGRRGRPWVQEDGNFAGTLLWPIAQEDLRRPALFSFVAAIALCDALEKLGVPSADIKV